MGDRDTCFKSFAFTQLRTYCLPQIAAAYSVFSIRVNCAQPIYKMIYYIDSHTNIGYQVSSMLGKSTSFFEKGTKNRNKCTRKCETKLTPRVPIICAVLVTETNTTLGNETFSFRRALSNGIPCFEAQGLNVHHIVVSQTSYMYILGNNGTMLRVC